MKLQFDIRRWFERMWPWVSKDAAAARVHEAVIRERDQAAKDLRKYRQVDLAFELQRLRELIAMLTRIEKERQHERYYDPARQIFLRIAVDGRVFSGIDDEYRKLVARECGRYLTRQLETVHVIRDY